MKNKFVSLLIMFGIFFLISLLRDNKTATEFNSVDKAIRPVQQELYRAEIQARLLDNTQKTFMELQGNPKESVFRDNELVGNVIRKLQALKISADDVPIPIKLKRSLEKVTIDHL